MSASIIKYLLGQICIRWWMGICPGEVSADIHGDEWPYLSALERKFGSVDEGRWEGKSECSNLGKIDGTRVSILKATDGKREPGRLEGVEGVDREIQRDNRVFYLSNAEKKNVNAEGRGWKG